MNAGRDLDALVAEKVMGWRVFDPIRNDCGHAVGYNRDGSSAKANFGWAPGAGTDAVIPRYSTDIAAAWTVVEKMAERRKYVCVEVTAQGWNAWVGNANTDASLAAAPLAICLAALQDAHIKVPA